MKNFSKIMLLALTMVGMLNAQTVEVTFVVDMNAESVSPNGVYVAGDFQAAAGFLSDWDAASSQMLDADLDGIYELTVTLPEGTDVAYKFLNGDDWPDAENTTDFVNCDGIDDGFGGYNRTFNTDSNTTLLVDTVCFSSCNPCPVITVNTLTFQVDMSLQSVSTLGVHVTGDFMDEIGLSDWSENALELLDLDGNNVYELEVLNIPTGTYQFKFLNGNAWGDDEYLNDLNCVVADGSGSFVRELTVASATTIVGPICYEDCGPCEFPVDVVFRVDMSNETVSPNGVHMAGGFDLTEGQPSWDPAGIELLDTDGDDVYEVALQLNAGTYQFKYINGNDWSGVDNDNESVPAACNVGGNREVVFGSDTTIQFCYNQCVANCVAYPDAAELLFVLDMNEVAVVELSGVWLMGSFTQPQWQDGRIQMFEHPDFPGVYAANVMVDGPEDVLYKFSNGEPLMGSSFQDGESYDFETDGCGVANGIGGWNRSFTRTGVAELAGVYCYNTCDNCNGINLGVGVNEIATSLSAHPNPAHTTLWLNENMTYQLLNILGEVILKGKGNSIDVSSLRNGVYFMKSKKDNQTIRFIKN